jgi:hypothetical protein
MHAAGSAFILMPFLLRAMPAWIPVLEINEPLAIVVAAAFGAVGSAAIAAWTWYTSREKDRQLESDRNRSLQAGVVADIRAILRVIDVVEITEHLVVQSMGGQQPLPMASGPGSENYFVLYAATAPNLGALDAEVARRAIAFYQLLKGSRDVAKTFHDISNSPNMPPARARFLRKEATRCVLGVLEHVYRNGLLAVLHARVLESRGSVPPQPELPPDRYLLDILAAWLMLVALVDLLREEVVLHVEQLDRQLREGLAHRRSDVSSALASPPAIGRQLLAELGRPIASTRDPDQDLNSLLTEICVGQGSPSARDIQASWNDKIHNVTRLKLQADQLDVPDQHPV